eukprot:scaffold80756_cov37-Attheya_sp.AAC.1
MSNCYFAAEAAAPSSAPSSWSPVHLSFFACTRCPTKVTSKSGRTTTAAYCTGTECYARLPDEVMILEPSGMTEAPKNVLSNNVPLGSTYAVQ